MNSQQNSSGGGILAVGVVVVLLIIGSVLFSNNQPANPGTNTGPGTSTSPGGSGTPTGLGASKGPGGGKEILQAVINIPKESSALIPSAPLSDSSDWPQPEFLAPVAKLKGKKAQKAKSLIDNARLWLAPRLMPAKPHEALGVDAHGRTFLKLGERGEAGLVSEDMSPGMYLLSINRKFVGQRSLEEAINASVNKDLAKELTSTHKPRPYPKFKGKADFAGCTFLDPSGAGTYFAMAYVYHNAEGIVIVLQHTPHSTPIPRKG